MSVLAPIFVSATLRDLASARDLVASVLHGMGYHTQLQPSCPVTGEDLRVKLRRLIDECGMLIQLVGFRCGEEPPTHNPDFGRVGSTNLGGRRQR